MTFQLIRVVTDPEALAASIDAEAAKQRYAAGREQLRRLAREARRAGTGRFPVEFERFESADLAASAASKMPLRPGVHFEYEAA